MGCGDSKDVLAVIVIGDPAVGKSTYTLRVVDKGAGSQAEAFTAGADSYCHSVTLENGTKVDFQLWDTAGQEQFADLVSQYFRDVSGIFFVFDLTNNHSLERLDSHWWSKHIRDKCPDAAKVIIANKMDRKKDTKVDEEDIQSFARKIDAKYFMTSALDGTGVLKSRNALLQKILDLGIDPGYEKPPQNQVSVNNK